MKGSNSMRIRLDDPELCHLDTSYLSKNYLIRVIEFDENSKQQSRLVGISTIIGMIGLKLFLSMIRRIETKGTQKERNKLRRGIWVDIYWR